MLAESKWTRAESNRRPKTDKRPLSYARIRPFVLILGTPIDGIPSDLPAFFSRLHAPPVLRFGKAHSLTSSQARAFAPAGRTWATWLLMQPG